MNISFADRRSRITWIILIILLMPVIVHSQTPELNRIKYEMYRKRLVDKFMVTGNNNSPGYYIPASFRNEQKGIISWGDATIFLSNYLAVLSTEYELNKQFPDQCRNTVQELFHTMKALERLDMTAETFFDPHYIISYPNGFFIRDDVPADFSRRNALTNRYMKDVPNVTSDYSASDKRTDEMSQDQVWHLLLGLSLVAKLVDDTARFEVFDENGKTRICLSEWAKQMSFRVIRHMHNEICENIGIAGDKIECLRYWMVKNPVTQQIVKRGGLPLFLNYGFAEAGNRITGMKYGDLHWGSSENAGIWFEITGRWQILQSITQKGIFQDFYNCGALATVGKIWDSKKLIRLFNHHRKLIFIHKPMYEHFALISYILYGGDKQCMMNEKNFYQHLLDIAPASGPENFGPGSGYVYEWSSISRLVWPERCGNNTGENQYGEYNGLDYMLLYNLYMIVYNVMK
ncbi:MAG: hypothetical protein NTW49_14725 [Bacteroidia bacterium]|nr:hypothetical protein [Bacteroidia bacterium]